jgi:large subunit ribosomal protein L3
MLNTIFATKGGMSQAWTKDGKRLPVTKCLVDQNIILGTQKAVVKVSQNSTFKKQPCLILEIGYGRKKLKNTPKPLRTKIEQSGFSFGPKQIRGIRLFFEEELQEEKIPFKAGQTINLEQVLEVGDVVKVQGSSKGRGFAGVVKRYGMAGGPRTHGQRDRERAVGSIGASADWGHVFKGKKMPGHYGNETVTVRNLTVVHIDPDKKEVWLSGPIPGHRNSIISITKIDKKNNLELDKVASGIKIQSTHQQEKTEKVPLKDEEKKDENSQALVKDEPIEGEEKQAQEKEPENEKEEVKKKETGKNKNKK